MNKMNKVKKSKVGSILLYDMYNGKNFILFFLRSNDVMLIWMRVFIFKDSIIEYLDNLIIFLGVVVENIAVNKIMPLFICF